MATVVVLCFLLINACCSQDNNTFSFGNVHGDDMVLQQAPYKAQIWGTSPTINDNIIVQLTNSDKNTLIQTINTIAIKNNEFNTNIWKVSFNPIPTSFSNYTITANSTSLKSIIALKNILFGDVYICSGQSNMEVNLSYVFNASIEIQNSNNYPYIRIMSINNSKSNEPQLQITQTAMPWSIANNQTTPIFSAVCWLFGRNLYNTLNYPLGLIQTAVGGTGIGHWVSPNILKQCNSTGGNSFQWNGNIYPFLQTTIKSVLWYQGEWDSKQPYCNYYNCLLKQLINDWRLQWSLKSNTNVLFPFGIVQLSVWDDENNVTCADNITCTAAAIVRYSQTGNYGYIPNKDMINTYFATAIDLGDPNATKGQIHPRYKQPLCQRLSNAALNVVYGQSDIYFFGPIAQKAMYNSTNNSVVVNFRNVGENGIEIKNYIGFEVLNGNNHWVVANKSVFSVGNYDIIVSLSIQSKISMIRYNWYKSPCLSEDGILNCAIYDKQYQLPAIPFVLQVS